MLNVRIKVLKKSKYSDFSASFSDSNPFVLFILHSTIFILREKSSLDQKGKESKRMTNKWQGKRVGEREREMERKGRKGDFSWFYDVELLRKKSVC